MATKADLDSALEADRVEWNKAEEAMKLAEQVNFKIINPSILELRYAGRRLVEAIPLMKSDRAAAKKLIDDAHFDCCRARHDAIDAATAKISADLDIAVRKIGPDIVLDKFPDLSKLISALNVTRGKIAKSRKNREDRDAIYETIQHDNLESVVKMFSAFQASEPLLVAAGVQARKDRMWGKFFGWGGLIFGAVGIAVGIYYGGGG